jgi:hypothetical protein
MAKKGKLEKADYERHEQVRERLRRLRALAEKAQAEVDRRKQDSVEPEA